MNTVLFVSLVLVVGLVAGKPQNEFQEHIDVVNAKSTTWRAGHNFPHEMSMKTIKGMCGALYSPSLRQSLPGIYSLSFWSILKPLAPNIIDFSLRYIWKSAINFQQDSFISFIFNNQSSYLMLQ